MAEKRTSDGSNGDGPNAKRSGQLPPGVTFAPDANGFVHPAAMAIMDPDSQAYKDAYKAFEANSTLYYEKYAAYYYEQASKNGAAPNSAPTTLVAISVTPLPNGQVEEIIDIPEQHIGRVIGKGGSAIRSIQQTASVKLEVPNECVPGTSVRRAKLTGTQAANAYARQMIEEKMRGNEARQHQLSQPLSGNLADPILSRVVPVPNDDAGRIIGKGGNTIRQLQEQSRARVEIEKAPKPGANVREVTITGTAQQIAMVEAMIAQKLKGEPSSGASQQQQQPVTEIKVLMPAEFVGRIIGKAGDTIKELQAQSGAHMTVIKDGLAGSNQRELVIRGTAAQQQLCMQLANRKMCEPTGDYSKCYLVLPSGQPALNAADLASPAYIPQGVPPTQPPGYGAPPYANALASAYPALAAAAAVHQPHAPPPAGPYLGAPPPGAPGYAPPPHGAYPPPPGQPGYYPPPPHHHPPPPHAAPPPAGYYAPPPGVAPPGAPPPGPGYQDPAYASYYANYYASIGQPPGGGAPPSGAGGLPPPPR